MWKNNILNANRFSPLTRIRSSRSDLAGHRLVPLVVFQSPDEDSIIPEETANL